MDRISLVFALFLTLCLIAPLQHATAQNSAPENAAAKDSAPESAALSYHLEEITPEKYPDADVVIVLDDTHVDVEESGLSHVTRTQVTKILTEKGAAQFAALRFDYDPASSVAEVKKVVIHRQNGKKETLSDAQILDLPQPQSMIYWGPRMKLVSVPRANPGDAIELQTYSKGFVIAYLGETSPDDEKYIPPMRGHYYDVVLFQGDYPIVKKQYVIQLPKDKPIRAQTFNGELRSRLDFDDNTLTYTYWKEDIPAIEREPRMVEDSDVMPKLVLATVHDWPEKSRWFLKVNEDAKAFEWNADIEAKVKEITRGLKTDDQKRQALLAWVASHIRYSGISMGKGEGYTLHPGTMTFSDRAGVCKDIAGMLITMLRAAGYTAYPAMTMAGARVEDLPADQFNHCVVAVETNKDKYKLYDPTWCPFSPEIWSSAEKPQNYVIGSPRGEELAETPEAPPSDNLVKVVSTGKIDAEGNLTGTLVVSGAGYSETSLRWSQVYRPAFAFRQALEQWIYGLSPRAELVSYKAGDPVDVNTPFQIKMQYRVPGYATLTSDSIVLIPPAARHVVTNRRLADFVPPTKAEKRTYDIFLRSTRQFLFEEKISLPGKYKFTAPPNPVPVDGPFGVFSATLSLKGKELRLSERLEVKKKIIPASGQPNLKQAVDAFETFGKTQLVLSQ